jgi:hypothetical protein
MFPHVAVVTAFTQFQEAIAEETRWAAQHAGELPDEAAEELLEARRQMRDEMLEEARKLCEGQEIEEGNWVDYGTARKSETELVIIGIQATMSEYEVAAMLGGGSKIRKVKQTGTETFVAFHHANDATLALETAAATILNMTNDQTVVTRARYRHGLHKHEAFPDGEQPEYEPYPPLTPTKKGMWTRWGKSDDDDDEEEGGTWTDWGKNQWVTHLSSRRSDRTNTLTGATSSRSSSEVMSGWANQDEERTKTRSRGQ